MITQTHSDYAKNTKQWAKNRTFFEGEEAVKAQGSIYLPLLGYHKLEVDKTKASEAYNTYAQSAVFFDAVYRTVTAMSGLCFRKSPYIFGKEAVKYREDFTVDNKSLPNAAKDLLTEVLLQGRVGLFVSYPQINTSDMTKKEVEEANIHAYSAIYKTEDIINWRVQKVKGSMVPVLVVLKELVDPKSNDIFNTDQVEQYRVLQIDELGLYKQTVYSSVAGTPLNKQKAIPGVQDANGTITEEFYPMMDGKPMTEIPFFCITPNGLSWEIERAPLNGIVSLNNGHYINSAAYESALSLTASPTLVLTNFQADEKAKNIVLGGNSAISVGPGGKAEFLEYQGMGLDAYTKAMDDKKKEIAVLGIRIFTNDTQSNVSAEAVSIESSGEQSVLASIANSTSEALTKAAKIMSLWDNPKANVKDVEIKLNTDFTPSMLSPNAINALSALWSKLGISDEELFDILKQGEVIPATTTYEEHKKSLEDSRNWGLLNTGLDLDPNRNLLVDSSRLITNDPNEGSKDTGSSGGSDNASKDE